jgi:hypothetical protein
VNNEANQNTLDPLRENFKNQHVKLFECKISLKRYVILEVRLFLRFEEVFFSFIRAHPNYT